LRISLFTCERSNPLCSGNRLAIESVVIIEVFEKPDKDSKKGFKALRHYGAKGRNKRFFNKFDFTPDKWNCQNWKHSINL
jgi:hypothetical protein